MVAIQTYTLKDNTAGANVDDAPLTPCSQCDRDEVIFPWLDAVELHVPFEDIMFFDADTDHQSATFFNGKTITSEEIVDTSMVFCKANGELVYDRAALGVFLEGEWETCVYFGAKFLMEAEDLEESAEQIAEHNPFSAAFALAAPPSHKTPATMQTVEHDPFSATFALGLPPNERAQPSPPSPSLSSASSFGCITTTQHDSALKKAASLASSTLAFYAIHQRSPPAPIKTFTTQVLTTTCSNVSTLLATSFFTHADWSTTLPFRRPFFTRPRTWVPKTPPPPPLDLSRPSRPRTNTWPAPIPTPHPVLDFTLSLRALRANLLTATIPFPTYSPGRAPLGDIQRAGKLPGPRLLTHPVRPHARVAQHVDGEVGAQIEAAGAAVQERVRVMVPRGVVLGREKAVGVVRVEKEVIVGGGVEFLRKGGGEGAVGRLEAVGRGVVWWFRGVVGRRSVRRL